MKKLVSKISLATVLVFSLFGSVASAHVSVVPNTSSPGAWETSSGNNNTFPTILSIVAVLLSLVSVGLAFRKK